jgi:hypothetical protein
MLLSSVGYGADWKHLTTDEIGDQWFYDTQSVSRGQDTTKVWVKIVLSDEDKKAFIENFPKIPNVENISQINNCFEINCSKNIWRVTSFVWYNPKGEVISKADFGQDKPFMEVPPDNIESKLAGIVCKNGGGGK